MNFLAHAHLSFNDKEITLGNFIADSVKGSSFNNFPQKIRAGILLHRKIDFFTDTHPVNVLTKNILKVQYGRYAGVVLDVLYDHFLSRNWHIFSDFNRQQFVLDFYKLLSDNIALMPAAAAIKTKYLIEQDWIENYNTLKGLDITYKRMAKRIGDDSKLQNGIELITDNYDKLNALFMRFFPQLIAYSKNQLHTLQGV